MTFSNDLQSAIEFVSAIMPADADWWVIGSTAVALLGIEVTVADIDVIASSEVISDVIAKIGLEPLPPKADSRFRSTPFARLERPGMLAIELMGGLQVNDTDGWRPLIIASRQAVRAGAATVYVPSPQEQIEIFHRFGRDKDIKRAALVSRFTTG